MSGVVRVPATMDEFDAEHPVALPASLSPAEGWSATGLHLPEGLSVEAWQEVGRKLHSIQGSLMWWIGDWLAFGERRYGETYKEAMEVTGYSLQHLTDAKYVAQAYAPSDRSEKVGWSFHKAAASRPVLERRELISLAAENGWSRRELVEEIQRRKAAEIVRSEQPTGSPFGYALRCLARMVGAVFDLDPAEFVGEAKGSPLQVHARQVLIYLLITEAEFQQSEVADGLGRHHSTIGHALAMVTELRNEPEIDRTFTWLGEMYRSLRDAREKVPQLVEALAP